jgi:hypothetical protein
MKDFAGVKKPHHDLFHKRKENVQHDETYIYDENLSMQGQTLISSQQVLTRCTDSVVH